MGAIFSLFALSQVIYPLFSAWPKARKLARENKLKRKIPIITFVFAPVFWGLLLFGSILLVNNNFSEFSQMYYITLIFILIVVIIQIPKQNRDLEADFKDSWGKYLKDEEIISNSIENKLK